MSAEARVLVVDDEPIVTEVVERYLVREGFRVTVRDGRAALGGSTARRPDLIVLDLMLPGVDGLEVFRRIRGARRSRSSCSSAKDEETDKILGLGLGADDYVAKPFSPREVVARVQAVLRRARAAPPERGDQLRYGGLKIIRRAREVRSTARGRADAKEFDLLYFLARARGRCSAA